MASQESGIDGHLSAPDVAKFPADDRTVDGAINIAPVDLPQTCSDPNVNSADVAAKFVEDFNRFLVAKDGHSLAGLFISDGAWRDHLCLSWDLRTFNGPEAIAKQLSRGCRLLRLHVDDKVPYRAPAVTPLDVAGQVKGIQFFVRVATDVGSGSGIARLAEESPGEWKILALYTVLEELADFPESAGARRGSGTELPEGKNWLQRREEERQFSTGDPAVLIIGAGQGGLALGARLKMLNVPTLIIDKVHRVGDSWRNRYSRLVLHDPVWYDHMPYVQFPAGWPVFTPKDKIANFFESYAELLELNVWTDTELVSSSWDETKKQWAVRLERGGSAMDGQKESRTLHPQHVVIATGASGVKNFPSISGRDTFRGDLLCHSADFPGARPNPSAGKKAVVIGSCNSAHDVAQDFHEHGYGVTMVQRSSTCVISSASIVEVGLKALYSEETSVSTADADLLSWSTPARLFVRNQLQLTALQNAADRETLAGLQKAGFKVDMGPRGAGLFVKYVSRGGGYYIDVGASQMIADGKIKVKQGQEVARIREDGVELADGSTLPADEIVFATGYQNMRTQAKAILGDEVGDRVGDVWGFDAEGEMRTVWRRSGHPGVWFMGGNLAMARYFSRVLALQIKALVEGIAGYESAS